MKTVLVVDDDSMNLKMASMILSRKGYAVQTASSGIECLRRLECKSADLVLLDVEMPGMNGIETLEEIRRMQGLNRLPVLFLTADVCDETIWAAERLGAAGCLQKPYQPQEFLACMEKLL